MNSMVVGLNLALLKESKRGDLHFVFFFSKGYYDEIKWSKYFYNFVAVK